MAFDLSEAALRLARTNGPSPGAHFAVADSSHLPLPDDWAEVYLSLETIEHVEEERLFLKEVARVLRPDGLFVLSTPNREVTNPGASITDRPWNPFHRREYSSAELQSLLGRAFETVEFYGQNPCSSRYLEILRSLRPFLPKYGAVRLRQLLKLPRFWFDNAQEHRVQRMTADSEFEYLIAVCSKPLS